MSQFETYCPSRRQFLRFSAAAGAVFAFKSLLAESSESEPLSFGRPRRVDLPDTGWRIWPDTKAEWKADRIFLPGEFRLSELPIHPPTGGWEVLSRELGVPAVLPATVEQYYWGEFGLRPYSGEEYKYEPSNPEAQKNGTADPEVRNGAYYGVSWWWKEIMIPSNYSGKRIFLEIRGARQRAEVFLNRQLVGYSILEELPFTCELTSAAKAGGKNELAIRLTNPGGRFDWVDRSSLRWGDVQIQKSHGFGGVDRGMVLSACDNVRVTDLWVLNTPEPRTINAYAQIENVDPAVPAGVLTFSVWDSVSNRKVTEKTLPIEGMQGLKKEFSVEINCPDARLWDLTSPNLYRLSVSYESGKSVDSLDRNFGFRWFAPEGIGSKALFRLNGRRIRLYSAISWGFWPLNGLFPTQEFSLKEVTAAKQLNLNCLNFHRNPGKQDVLDVQDRVGLLRFMEPGGGGLAVETSKESPQEGSASGRSDPPAMRSQATARFQQRYMEAKILHMMRTFRSHPSLVGWTLQNEFRTELTPELLAILQKMHAVDPSRCVVANDGFTMRSHQAWWEPYAEKPHTSPLPGEAVPLDLTVNSAGGWWDDHQGAGGDVWVDSHWQGPDKYQWQSKNTAEIVQWGEMEGSAMLDNHSVVLMQIDQRGGKSYDRIDHKEIDTAYDSFLSRWGFRQAYPTTSSLYTALGKRCYDTWTQYMENARICDVNDFLAISGWESTSIENHSGIVDVFRNYKANPAALTESLAPVHPVAKQRAMVFAVGEKGIFDLFLLNDTGKPVQGQLLFFVVAPSGTKTEIGRYNVPEFVADQLSYPVKMEVESPVFEEEGEYVFYFALTGSASGLQKRSVWVTKTEASLPKPARVGVIGGSTRAKDWLGRIANLTVEDFAPGAKYDLLLFSRDATKGGSRVQFDPEAGYRATDASGNSFSLPPEVLALVKQGTPLFLDAQMDWIADGAARDLAAAGAFQYEGMVGPCRAPWMGAWYFNREHPVYSGMPVNQALGVYYQVKGNSSGGWLVAGKDVEVITGYSRDHDRKVGAGVVLCKLGQGKIVLNRVPAMQKVLDQRFYHNVVQWLLT